LNTIRPQTAFPASRKFGKSFRNGSYVRGNFIIARCEFEQMVMKLRQTREDDQAHQNGSIHVIRGFRTLEFHHESAFVRTAEGRARPYGKRTVDIQYRISRTREDERQWRVKGIANRTDFDLKRTRRNQKR
jgi:glycyl-tRNA synthetase (class II)